MKTLGTGKLYIKDLFDKDRFFRIPEYQRAYVWEAQQINELLNDVNDAMESDPEKEYFLGCMIWNVVNKRTGGYAYDSLDILDGQQRLITQGKRKKNIGELCYVARPAARTVSM
ncbi:DUF262 domain-containing protein [Halomicronema sp. CCY15110]|uniref:DUF262 domain-containing protein n=1 Tax=Halomicronema sp. CCY15110 TaxID=2767773 RepID=UPI001951A817|nr:DUF262 domain-containing protein [Halomicronema sp. CCY15110]